MSKENITYGRFERAISSNEAVRLAKEAAHRLGLVLTTRKCGGTVKTTYCELIDKNGRKSNGLGKGLGEQSSASAIFEAFEHLYSIFSDAPDTLIVRTLNLEGVDIQLSAASPDFKLICGTNAVSVSRIPFRKINHPNDTIDFPFFLTNPYFKAVNQGEIDVLRLFSLMRYSTNSGTAAGTSQSEAILHGLLEVIERDAIGIELLRTVIRKNAAPVREFRLTCLPTNLQKFCNLVERDTRGKLSIWNITSDLNIPVILASISIGGNDGSRYFGSGASLSIEYAIERAVLETVQYFHAHEMNGKSRPRSGHQGVSGMPGYIKCFLEAGFFGFRSGTSYIDSLESAKNNELDGKSIDQQVAHIVDLLQFNNIEAYWRPIVEADVVVTQVVVPKLERFHLVSRGVPVAPSARGRTVLASEI